MSDVDVSRAGLRIRPGEQADLERLSAIYSHCVETFHPTFDTEVLSLERRAEWLS
jgi:L-amino acid N-acyltransferase YncA